MLKWISGEKSVNNQCTHTHIIMDQNYMFMMRCEVNQKKFSTFAQRWYWFFHSFFGKMNQIKCLIGKITVNEKKIKMKSRFRKKRSAKIFFFLQKKIGFPIDSWRVYSMTKRNSEFILIKSCFQMCVCVLSIDFRFTQNNRII